MNQSKLNKTTNKVIKNQAPTIKIDSLNKSD